MKAHNRTVRKMTARDNDRKRIAFLSTRGVKVIASELNPMPINGKGN